MEITVTRPSSERTDMVTHKERRKEKVEIKRNGKSHPGKAREKDQHRRFERKASLPPPARSNPQPLTRNLPLFPLHAFPVPSR